MAITTTICGGIKFRIATAERPSPEKQHKGSEDANFSNEYCIAVADGVGGWNDAGIDPSLYSRRLVKEISMALSIDSERYTQDPKELAVLAARRNDQTGSSTLVIVTIDTKLGILKSANIGDSGYMILRKNSIDDYKLVFRSREQQHSFNFPFQIGTNGDQPEVAQIQSHQILIDDLVVVGSDGLFDNMFNKNIIDIINTETKQAGSSLQSIANALLEETYRLSLDKKFISPFAKHAQEHKYYFRGGKSDDITIVIGEIVTSVEQNINNISSS